MGSHDYNTNCINVLKTIKIGKNLVVNWVMVVDLLRFLGVKIRILGCRLKFIELKHVRYKIQNIKQHPGVGYVGSMKI